MSLLNALAASGGGAPKLDASDVFSTYLYTGNGTTQSIVNGIDLAGKGGMVWFKNRTTVSTDHQLYDTVRGATNTLRSNLTSANLILATGLTSFNSNGFSIGTNGGINANTDSIASWTFIEAPKFFHQVTKVHTTGTASTVDLSTLGTVGMVTVKSTVGTSNWFTWHRSLTAGNLTYLNLTNAQTADTTISVSGTTLTIASTAPSDTYIVYAWAHDVSADGIIQCGSFTTDAGGNATVALGWEPQYLQLKAISTTSNWYVVDSMRGLNLAVNGDPLLYLNSSGAETSIGIQPTATGFFTNGQIAASQTYIYMAIRRPNKVPTSGTQVYNAIARTGTGAAATVSGVGFAPDLVFTKRRTNTTQTLVFDRLRGFAPKLLTQSTAIEDTTGSAVQLLSFEMDGIKIGTDSGFDQMNFNTGTQIDHFFKRAKGFFDEVCFTGTGVAKTEPHNLGVIPELWLVKGRSGATQWVWGSSLLAATEKVNMPTTAGKATDATAWNSTYPTASVFTVGTSGDINTSTATYVAYLFATLAGISKVGTYTGNGTLQTINCGFTTGARFVLIFRTSAAGDFYIWDTVRGIVAANDPHLSLNTTGVEVTTDDSIDPDATGFIVNQVAATNVNVTSATYIYLAIS